MLKDNRVADVAHQNMRCQMFERDIGAFCHPERVAAVDTGTDKLCASFLNQRLEFTLAKIASVIFERDFDARIQCQRTGSSQRGKRVIDMRAQGQRRTAIAIVAEQCPQIGRTQLFGNMQHLAQLFDCRALSEKALEEGQIEYMPNSSANPS